MRTVGCHRLAAFLMFHISFHTSPHLWSSTAPSGARRYGTMASANNPQKAGSTTTFGDGTDAIVLNGSTVTITGVLATTGALTQVGASTITGAFGVTGATTLTGALTQASGAVSLGGSTLGVLGATPVAKATTGVASAAIVAGSGTGSKQDDTYGGYTVAQIVKALQLYGLLT